MSDGGGKLTPAEFLAQLGDENSSPEAPGSVVEAAVDVGDLDFSDLDAAETEQQAKDCEPEQFTDTSMADPLEANEQLSELFERVHSLIGSEGLPDDDSYKPPEPESLEDTGLVFEDVEQLVLKFLMARGSATGRSVSQQISLPFQIADPILKSLKADKLVVFKNAATMGDYEYTLTDLGRERARRYSEHCTYFGAATVPLEDYLVAMAAQSIGRQLATEDDLRSAFSDLIISQAMFDRLGPAINSGRGMFLFGSPGNGKTSIAERVTNCFGTTIWIPRTLGIEGDIIRVFDPAIHTLVDEPKSSKSDSLLSSSSYDRRWVHVVRPTVVVGGELTMAELEVKQNPSTKICEAPLQLKSNCGTLVIDDFGRQRMPTDELLNRWIVPLEKRYDYLNLPCGKKIQVPFDQLIIFSTNMEPKDLVDEAFLRRIPYKIEVSNPSEAEFRQLLQLVAPMQGFQYDKDAVEYLVEEHYRKAGRTMRSCHPRDLLQQVKNFCTYKGLPRKMTPQAFDIACLNYFTVM